MSTNLPTTEIIKDHALSFPLGSLFDFLPDVYLYVKDADGRFLKMNAAMLSLRGLKSESDVVGLTDYDLHPSDLADRYRSEDRRVMDSGSPLPDQVWLVPDAAGHLKWYLSSKIPLMNPDGEVIGIAGVMREFRTSDSPAELEHPFEQVLQHVLDRYSERILIPDLADRVHLSVSQFERTFRSRFQMTPQEYIMRVRLNAASQQLIKTDQTIARIANNCGFYDHSYFTKQFRKHFGVAPSRYRKGSGD